MKYSEENLTALINEVETEFSDHLKKAETEKSERIAKSKTADVTKTKEANTEVQYDAEDIKEMNDMYGSMSKSEKEAHYQSIKVTLFGDSEPVDIKKTEETAVEVKKTEERVSNLSKAELGAKDEEITSLKKSMKTQEESHEKLQKSFSDLLGKLKGFVSKEAPSQKAITKIEFVKKSEEDTVIKKKEGNVDDLSKKEVTKILSEKAKSPDMKKSDRDAINNYYFETQNIDSIRHLL